MSELEELLRRVEAYAGAEKIHVQHDSLQPGDDCPDCNRGTLYETNRPGVLVRFTGHAPVQVKVYLLQKLRCGLCGKVFKAQAPKSAGTRKYDATAGSMIALLKYGTGMPFNRMALFFSGRKHAGENLGVVLAERARELGPPIQMCDALSRNLPAELETIVANCLAHGRRKFVDVAEHFPDECRRVLESLAVVYRNDAVAREQNLSPQARLEFHQSQSGPAMDGLHAWLNRHASDLASAPQNWMPWNYRQTLDSITPPANPSH